jgi:hypothetical protein
MTEPDHDARRRAYEHVVECVRHQTTPKQPPGVVPRQLYLHLVEHGNLDREPVRRAVQAARENDALVRWRDADGTPRLTRTDDPKTLQRARDWLTDDIEEWTDADRAALGRLNTALLEVDDDD